MEPNTKLFILHDGTTYDNYGSKMFCCKTGTSGLEEPQETPQITLFSSDVTRAKLLITFKDTESLMKNTWDSKVRVFFKQNAWWEEAI